MRTDPTKPEFDTAHGLSGVEVEYKPNHLIAKIPNPEALRGRPDPALLIRVEAAIAKERRSYLSEMAKDVQRLSELLVEEATPGELWPIAHELRCMAGTYGYSFLSQVANILCALVKKRQTLSRLPAEVTDVFAHALQRARNYKGAIEAREEAVIEGLRKIVAQHIGSP
jgi:hypothetical protein